MLMQTDTTGNHPLIHIQMFHQLIAPFTVLKAKEVQFDSEKLGNEFTETIEQHL